MSGVPALLRSKLLQLAIGFVAGPAMVRWIGG